MAPHPKATVADFPSVASQWHPTQNGGATPEEVPFGTSKKYWWVCDKGPDHVWHASPNGRIKAVQRNGVTRFEIRGCPACAGKQASVTNSLAALFPEIASEWHPLLNGNTTPDMVVARSNKGYWWKCPRGPEHEWPAQPNNRISGDTGCPCCAGRKLSVTNCLETLRPDLAREWHPEKNGKLTPRDIVAGTSKRYWWRCPAGPDHEWPQSPNQRKNAGCPYCRGLRVSVTNSLAARFPEIAKFWHPDRNGDLTPHDVTYGTGREYWWRCPRGPDHEWRRSPNDMVNDKAAPCPFCANVLLSVTNSLATKFPKLAAEFRPTNNLDSKTGRVLTAADVIAGSQVVVWWQCRKNPTHEWPTPVVRRTHNRTGCPWCRVVPRSRVEILIAYELAYVVGFGPDAHKLRIGRRVVDVDIMIPELSTIVEYDGSYTHRGKEENDRRKTRQLTNAGWTVIRLREEPLQCVTEHDVVIPVTRARDDAAIKNTVDIALRKIASVRGVCLPKMKGYLRRKTCANRTAAESHTEALLTAAAK